MLAPKWDATAEPPSGRRLRHSRARRTQLLLGDARRDAASLGSERYAQGCP